MTMTIILVLIALLALVCLLWLAKGRTVSASVLQNPAEHMQAVDVEAFRNLVDPDEEEFLRANLSPSGFRKIQRQRLRAAVEYVSCAAQNAAILLRVADAGRRSPDPATAEAAEKLVDNATTVIGAIVRSKPSAAKGKYIKSVTLSSTMGPGVPLDSAVADAAGKH